MFLPRNFKDKIAVSVIIIRLIIELEKNPFRICEGTRQPEDVLREQISKYRNLFQIATQQVNKIERACEHYLDEQAQDR